MEFLIPILGRTLCMQDSSDLPPLIFQTTSPNSYSWPTSQSINHQTPNQKAWLTRDESCRSNRICYSSSTASSRSPISRSCEAAASQFCGWERAWWKPREFHSEREPSHTLTIANDLGRTKRSLHLSRLKETAKEKCTRPERTTHRKKSRLCWLYTRRTTREIP